MCLLKYIIRRYKFPGHLAFLSKQIAIRPYHSLFFGQNNLFV